MLRRELEQINSKEKHTVSFFEDDSIQVLREQIAKSADSHPDRMFILVALKLPADYYKNPLNWEGLFARMSYNGKPIEKKPFTDYQLNYRFPNTSISYKSYDRAEWMEYPPELESIHSPTSDFIEYRILGVEEKKSFILPLDSDDVLVNRISSANIPVPQNNVLVSSLYPGNIERFIYDFYTEEKSSYHYPLLTSETPKVLSLESIRLLDKNAKLLTDLLTLKVDQEGAPSIIKTKFYIPWIETDFGSAVRTRFEQIFYGLTVSKDVPYICLFTSNDEINRHKFFVEDVKNKDPYLNMSWWTSWTNISKPQRNIPTLLLYRGSSKHHFDRIAITANDLIISSYRPENNKETLSEIRSTCNKWLYQFDSVIPYLNENDIKLARWELQDLSYVLKYESRTDLSLLRFNCISSIYGIPDKSKSVFTLLRNDHETHGITSLEIKIIQMMREGPINPDTVAEELSMTRENAKKLISAVTGKLEENSRLGARLFRGYPTVSFGPNFALVSTVTELDRSSKYVDILRYILSTEESEELNKICPPRLQKVDVESAVIKTEESLDAAVINEYDDLFDESYDPTEKMETETTVTESVAESQTLATVSKQTTNYGYFHSKLQEFDPQTFPGKSLYPKKCNLKHQPVVLTDKDKKELSDPSNKNKGEGKYDPYKTGTEDKRLDVEKPDGTLICPEYWCMKNEIPLREEDLVFDEEGAHCPVCMGKLQTNKNADVRQYPLIKRDTGFNFPGYMKYNSPSNGKIMPCCYKTAYTKTDKDVEVKDRYYVFKTNHRDLKVGRLAKLDDDLIRSLHLGEKYTLLDNQRIPESASGFFRVGMGNIIETLPNFLGMKVAIPSPKDAVDTVMKCSFFATWSKTSDTHASDIEDKLKDIDHTIRPNIARIISGIEDAFSNKELSSIEQLEYAAISLKCDVFRVSIDTMKVGCLFYTSLVRQKTRAITILQSYGDIDILSYVKRAHSGFGFISNVYDDPFKKDTVVTLETLRSSACSSDIPSYETAVGIVEKIYAGDTFSVVLDPLGRGQALYIPDKMVLPFKSTPLPDSEYSRISGYQNIDRLPTLATMKDNLTKASESSSGYEFQEDLFNSRNQIVEILTKSGLRVPVKPEDGKNGESLQILESIKELGENSLVFGDPSDDLKNTHNDISYESEVYEFLLFQLTKDLQVTNFDGLRDSLNESPLRRKAVEPRLKRWFEKFVAFVDIDKPHEFISKIRTPCGQFKTTPELCNKGNLCAWDSKEKICKINIKKTVKRDKLFNRLFATLFNNSKIRSMVLDGRTTPFFSTILYISLPHELIITDNQISSITSG